MIIVPALVLLFGMSQHSAQGTTLAMMIPPIGIVAALQYYRGGYTDIHTAAYLCLGFIAGSSAGSLLALQFQDAVLHKIFGVSLLLIGLKFLILD